MVHTGCMISDYFGEGGWTTHNIYSRVSISTPRFTKYNIWQFSQKLHLAKFSQTKVHCTVIWGGHLFREDEGKLSCRDGFELWPAILPPSPTSPLFENDSPLGSVHPKALHHHFHHQDVSWEVFQFRLFDPPAAGVLVGRVWCSSSQSFHRLTNVKSSGWGRPPDLTRKVDPRPNFDFFTWKKDKKLRHWCTFLDSRVNAPSEYHSRFVHQFTEPMCEPCHSFWDIHLTRWLFATNRKTRKRPQGNHCTLGGHVIGTTRSPTCNISDDVPLFGSLSHDKVVWGREGGGRVGGETCGFCSSIHPQVSCHLPACCC